jgi:hypothetical protein
VGPFSTVGNEEFNQHLENSTGAGSVLAILLQVYL